MLLSLSFGFAWVLYFGELEFLMLPLLNSQEKLFLVHLSCVPNMASLRVRMS